MKYLAVSTNTKDVSAFAVEEYQRAMELRADGILTDAWLKSDFSGAVLVLECADKDELTAILNTLPIVIHDASTFAITEIIDLDSARPGIA